MSGYEKLRRRPGNAFSRETPESDFHSLTGMGRKWFRQLSPNWSNCCFLAEDSPEKVRDAASQRGEDAMEYSSLKSSKKCFCSSSGSIASATSSSSSRSSSGTAGKHGLRTVHLKRQCGYYVDSGGRSREKPVPDPKTGSFGFSFRGGREFGTGFFISAVESDSEAHLKGLKVRLFPRLPRTPNISATLTMNREPPFRGTSRETLLRSRPVDATSRRYAVYPWNLRSRFQNAGTTQCTSFPSKSKSILFSFSHLSIVVQITEMYNVEKPVSNNVIVPHMILKLTFNQSAQEMWPYFYLLNWKNT